MQRTGLLHTRWPGRLERLWPPRYGGPAAAALTERLGTSLPPDCEIWLDAAHNPVLSDVYRTFLGALRDSIETFSSDPDASRDGHEDHVALEAAIANGDPEAAITATIHILATTLDQIAALTPAEDGPHGPGER